MFQTVTIFLVFIIYKAATNDPANENPLIVLSFKDGKNKTTNNYTVYKDKPLIFSVQSFHQYIRCYSKIGINLIKNDPDFISLTKLNENTTTNLSVDRVTSEMSTTWVCKNLRDNFFLKKLYWHSEEKYGAIDLFFNLHVRGAKAVGLTANSRSLPYVTTNLTVDYDGETSYTYVDGEDLEISCKKVQDALEIHSDLSLEYFNASGVLLFQTKSRETNPHVFRIVLKSDNDKDYLDCVRATKNPFREYRYRITFLKKKDLHAGSMQSAVIMAVNHKDLLSNDYFFGYKDNILLVTCRKMDDHLPGNLTVITYSKKMKLLGQTFRSRSYIAMNISTTNLTFETLGCGISTRNKGLGKPITRVSFMREDEHMRGLPKNNILYQYTNYERQWVIEHQYSVNETFNLTCVVNTGSQNLLSAGRRKRQSDLNPFLWVFEDSTFYSEADYLPTNPSIKWSQKTFTKTLNATHNGTLLRCTYYPIGSGVPIKVFVIFRLKPEWAGVISKKHSEDIESVSDESSTHNTVLIYSLLSTFGVIAVCTILIIIIKKIYKRRSEDLPAPTMRPDPATVYYENMLSVFAPMNEREAAELENHYEEIQ